MMPTSAERAIRVARAGFNRALAEADLAAVSKVLSPRVTLVTGTDSAVLVDRKAQLQVWKRDFAREARTIFTRHTQSVTVSPVEPIAMEYGNWMGVASPSGEIEAGGCYCAKWREATGRWVIEAEIFVTLE